MSPSSKEIATEIDRLEKEKYQAEQQEAAKMVSSGRVKYAVLFDLIKEVSKRKDAATRELRIRNSYGGPDPSPNVTYVWEIKERELEWFLVKLCGLCNLGRKELDGVLERLPK